MLNPLTINFTNIYILQSQKISVQRAKRDVKASQLSSSSKSRFDRSGKGL